MNSKELRIGNYIHHNPDNAPYLGTYLTVYELQENQINTFYYHVGQRQNVRQKKDYAPIPLCIEWFKLLGFLQSEFDNKVFEYSHSNGTIHVDLDHKEIYFFDEESKMMQDIEIPNFVHELQNIVYYFEKVELTAKIGG